MALQKPRKPVHLCTMVSQIALPHKAARKLCRHVYTRGNPEWTYIRTLVIRVEEIVHGVKHGARAIRFR